MDLYNKVYTEALLKNTAETARWKQYEQEHQEVKSNLDLYRKQLKVDILIPIGSKAFLPGHLYHTGEVMASHGSGYFSDCSVDQAKMIVDHRLKTAHEMLQKYDRERELFTDKIEVPFVEEAFGGQEIVEEYDDQREQIWREEHRKRIKELKKREALQRQQNKQDGTDREIIEHLEELELMEELEEEISGLNVPVETDDQLRKLMSGEIKLNEKKRIAHDRTSAVGKDRETQHQPCTPVNNASHDDEQCEIETTDEDDDDDDGGSSASEDNVSPAFLKLLQVTKSMNKRDKIATFKRELKEIQFKLKQSAITIEEKVDLYDLSYELEEALDFLQPSWDESSENGSKKKKVIKFANDVSVKIIDDEETNTKSNKTLELKIKHSNECTNHSTPTDENNEIQSPVDIYRLFELCASKELVATPKLETKSILKKRNTPLPEIPHESTTQKRSNIVTDIIGDIVEHKDTNHAPNGNKQDLTEPKKVSRFKQLRK
uniref:Uncharacterized protein n=1 Tax=Culex tarsalis TaxID=7177 RepID=A0A1Q3F4U1_CULTA